MTSSPESSPPSPEPDTDEVRLEIVRRANAAVLAATFGAAGEAFEMLTKAYAYGVASGGLTVAAAIKENRKGQPLMVTVALGEESVDHLWDAIEGIPDAVIVELGVTDADPQQEKE